MPTEIVIAAVTQLPATIERRRNLDSLMLTMIRGIEPLEPKLPPESRNRLTTVKDRPTSGGSVIKQVDYAYDAFNRLVKRTYDADGAGSGSATTQYWIYDEGINSVMQFDVSSSSNLSHRYLWTDTVDELMADEIVGTGADTQYALGDHLGTIRDIANFNESTSVTSVTNHRTYSSFGTLTAESNSAIDLIFGYTGKQLDDVTGLQHNLFRWYDSALGQWLTEDPLSFVAGDENLKRYVRSRPTSAIDPFGLFEEPTKIVLLNLEFAPPPPIEPIPPLIPEEPTGMSFEEMLQKVQQASKYYFVNPQLALIKTEYSGLLKEWKAAAVENAAWGIPVLVASGLALQPMIADQIEKLEEFTGNSIKVDLSNSYSIVLTNNVKLYASYTFIIKDIADLMKKLRALDVDTHIKGNSTYQVGAELTIEFSH